MIKIGIQDRCISRLRSSGGNDSGRPPLQSGTIRLLKPSGAIEIESLWIIWTAVTVTPTITGSIDALVTVTADPAADRGAACRNKEEKQTEHDHP
jgi:hypothetical protein